MTGALPLLAAFAFLASAIAYALTASRVDL